MSNDPLHSPTVFPSQSVSDAAFEAYQAASSYRSIREVRDGFVFAARLQDAAETVRAAAAEQSRADHPDLVF